MAYRIGSYVDSIGIEEFTFRGDPMRIDYRYRHYGTHGDVQTPSVSRAPGDCKNLAYTADRIARRAPFASEFLAVTDIVLQPGNASLHQRFGPVLQHFLYLVQELMRHSAVHDAMVVA
jgi:hypothetical protein